MTHYVQFPLKLKKACDELMLNYSRASVIAIANYLNSDAEAVADAKTKFLDYRSKDYERRSVLVNDVFTFLLAKFVGNIKYQDLNFYLFMLSLKTDANRPWKPYNSYLTHTLVFTKKDAKKLNGFLKRHQIRLNHVVEFLLYFNKSVIPQDKDYDEFIKYLNAADTTIKLITYSPVLKSATYFETFDQYPFVLMPRAVAKFINYSVYKFLKVLP